MNNLTFWRKKQRRGKIPAAAGAKAVTKVGGALTRATQVSPALKKFLGVKESTRPKSMKCVWDYI